MCLSANCVSIAEHTLSCQVCYTTLYSNLFYSAHSYNAQLTLTKPYLTRTPHPTNVMPLHSLGNKIPVFGSVAGDSIVGSAPSRPAAEHKVDDNNGASFLLLA
mmetsp:Transcript_28697/g.41022  ORF Transcript_28697/g.41022 Transcript_28697/m.41022 type:complete len:103 (+) Transcript_28697:774-1082(+)